MSRWYAFAILTLIFCLTGCCVGGESEAGLQSESKQIYADAESTLADMGSTEDTESSEPLSDSENEVLVSDSEITKEPATEITIFVTETLSENATQPPLIDVHVHSYEKTVVASTCTKKGYTLNKCACGESYKSSYKDKIDHAFGEWTVTVKASYFGEGKESRVCTLCGKEESVVLPIIPHYTCEERGIDVYEVQRLTLEYIATLEDAIADPTLIGTDRGGTAGWTLRVSTYPFETQEELLERVKEAVFSEYNSCLQYYTKVSLHVWIGEHPLYEGDYFLHILYN